MLFIGALFVLAFSLLMAFFVRQQLATIAFSAQARSGLAAMRPAVELAAGYDRHAERTSAAIDRAAPTSSQALAVLGLGDQWRVLNTAWLQRRDAGGDAVGERTRGDAFGRLLVRFAADVADRANLGLDPDADPESVISGTPSRTAFRRSSTGPYGCGTVAARRAHVVPRRRWIGFGLRANATSRARWPSRPLNSTGSLRGVRSLLRSLPRRAVRCRRRRARSAKPWFVRRLPALTRGQLRWASPILRALPSWRALNSGAKASIPSMRDWPRGSRRAVRHCGRWRRWC